MRSKSRAIPRQAQRIGQHRKSGEFLSGLATCDKTLRARQLQLLPVLLPEEALAKWERWWKEIDLLEAKTRKLLRNRQRPLSRTHEARCRALEEQIKAVGEAPPPFKWRNVADPAGIICATASPKAFANVLGCIRLLSDWHNGKSTREIFLEEWVGAFRTPEKGRRVIDKLLGAQRSLLERLAGDTAKQAWVCRHVTDEMINSWISEARPQRLIEPAIGALSALISNAGTWTDRAGPFADCMGWETLIAAVKTTGDAVVAGAMLAAVPPIWEGLYGAPWVTLSQLVPGIIDPRNMA